MKESKNHGSSCPDLTSKFVSFQLMYLGALTFRCSSLREVCAKHTSACVKGFNGARRLFRNTPTVVVVVVVVIVGSCEAQNQMLMN